MAQPATQTRDALIRRFLPLARRLARRYHGGGEPLEDLVQVASLGLVKAADRYDRTRGVSFSSYAVPTITGELKRHFRDNAWATHVPRGMREQALRVNTAVRRFTEKRGRVPTTAELAEQLDLAEQDVRDAQLAYVAFDASSLDAPVTAEDGEPQTRLDMLGSDDAGYALAEHRAAISRALRTLPPNERRVLWMRFIEDRTQSEIAARFGVSQMQVSRILRRTLERMRIIVDRRAPSRQ